MEPVTDAAQAEVVVRFDRVPAGEPGERQVHGTVTVTGDGQRSTPFTGWLQLLSQLEAASGCAAGDE